MEKSRKLYRSSQDQKIAGVCAGFARYFDLDVTLVRLAFVLLALSGPGLVFYIICWLVMPLEPETEAEMITDL